MKTLFCEIDIEDLGGRDSTLGTHNITAASC